MNKSENIKLGLSGLLDNKLRTILTMLGIIFGVAAVISMLSISEGAKVETLQQIEMLGTNNIIVNKVSNENNNENSEASFSLGLNMDDVKAIKEINPYVEYITPQMDVEKQVVYKSSISNNIIIGTTPDYLGTFNSKIYEGKFFKDYHLASFTNVCVIGYGVKEKLFKFEEALGKKIKIGEQWFEIIGIVAPKNISSSGMQSFGLRNFNEDIYIPLTTLQTKLGITQKDRSQTVTFRRGGMRITNNDQAEVIDRKSLDKITIKVKDSEHLKQAAFLTERILNRRHYGVKDYQVILPEELLEQKQKTQRIFNIVMGAIASISLIVGGIGIMNIMLANILERTKEIGIRRAIGAKKLDIMVQFLFEAIIISVVGGILGIFLGILMTSLISQYAEWKTVISIFSIILAFVVSVSTGIIFGIYPAKKAADKNPIESLRYE